MKQNLTPEEIQQYVRYLEDEIRHKDEIIERIKANHLGTVESVMAQNEALLKALADIQVFLPLKPIFLKTEDESTN